jgi:small subunit ribosomal protein S4
MGRHLDPVCKLCRREGIKLYLKGTRCETPKCAIERRNTPPGMHNNRRGKPSEYGIRLREKQKLKRFYGPNRAAARQLVTHGHVTLTGRACNIPSLLVKAGDTIAIKNRPRSLQLVRLSLGQNPPPPPDYLERSSNEPPEGRMSRLPTREDVDPRIKEIREQMIIEFSTR